jgi:hypothetical protein
MTMTWLDKIVQNYKTLLDEGIIGEDHETWKDINRMARVIREQHEFIQAYMQRFPIPNDDWLMNYYINLSDDAKGVGE